jgi:GTP-binding protein HflX
MEQAENLQCFGRMEISVAELYEIKEQEERFVLVGVASSDQDDTVQSLEELEELAATAGALTVGKIIQNRESVHPGTYIGKGKIEEVRALAMETEATGVVCDDELTPAQLKNLEDALQMKVLDRTVIILDIFASHASTKEGKIQVELAQLRYRSTRLIGLRNSLSRLGGGIGTRGPGEKKLEMDRRIIKERITQLRRELDIRPSGQILVCSIIHKYCIPKILPGKTVFDRTGIRSFKEIRGIPALRYHKQTGILTHYYL